MDSKLCEEMASNVSLLAILFPGSDRKYHGSPGIIYRRLKNYPFFVWQLSD
jgi:hypothetical protein